MLRALKRILRDNPTLIRARSSREHGATLLHYVSANGVEGYRQRTPKNIVAIARLLLDAGAEVDATADVYGGGGDDAGIGGDERASSRSRRANRAVANSA